MAGMEGGIKVHVEEVMDGVSRYAAFRDGLTVTVLWPKDHDVYAVFRTYERSNEWFDRLELREGDAIIAVTTRGGRVMEALNPDDFPKIGSPEFVLRPLRADEIRYLNEHHERCPSCNHIAAFHDEDPEYGDLWCSVCEDTCRDGL